MRALVTSRDHLTDLVTRHGARPVALDALDDEQARTILVHRIGRRRVDTAPAAVTRIITACAGLPLTLGIVAARACHLGLDAIADEAYDPSTRLQAFDDAQIGLRTVLSGSYTALTDAQARAFCLLGMAPWVDITVPAAAALTGSSAADTAATLQTLRRQSLLGQTRAGRWRMHDLVRLYAAERGRRHLPGADRTAAARRFVDYHLHTADHADRLLYPLRRHLALAPAAGGTGQRFAGEAPAWAWLDSEHRTILAAQRLAARHGWDDAVWQLAAALSTLHIRRGHVQEDIAVWQAALTAARHADEHTVHALARYRLGWAYHRAGDQARAVHHLDRALLLAERITARPVQADTHLILAQAHERLGRLEGGVAHARRALHLNRALDHLPGLAETHNILGLLGIRRGHYEQARADLDNALVLARGVRHHVTEAAILSNLGDLALRTGDHPAARRHHDLAVVLTHELGDTYREADSLVRLGEALAAAGHDERARAARERALILYRGQQRHLDADRVERRLHRPARFAEASGPATTAP